MKVPSPHLSRVKIIIPLVLMAYLAVGLSTWELEKRYGIEAYPFFHWALFAYPTGETERYEIYLYEVDGRRYDPPVRMQDTEEYQTMIAQEPDMYHTFKAAAPLATAIRQSDKAATQRSKALLENNFLWGDRVHYGLYKVEYDPEVRLETGEVISAEKIRDFYKR